MTNKTEEPKWFVAYVRSCQERRIASLLERMDICHYLPIQKERHRWSDRVKVVDRLVIPGMIFIRTTETTRIKLASEILLLSRFMSRGGPYNPVVIPDSQMEDFRFIVEHSEEAVLVSSEDFAPGDYVEVVSGPLKGLKTNVVNKAGQNYVALRIDMLGTAMAKVSSSALKKIARDGESELS